MRVFLLVLLTAAASARAAILEFSGNPTRMIEAGDVHIPVYPKAKVNVKSGPKPAATDLKLTGAGLRNKKVLLLSVKAYTLASYVENLSILDRADPMKGLKKNRTKALYLTFVRDVDAGKIRGSFTESLEKNGVDMSSPTIKQVFAKLDFDMKEKSSMTILGYQKNPEMDVLVFEVPTGSFSIEGKDLATTFWKIWFGKAADSGIEELQAQLLPAPSVKAAGE